MKAEFELNVDADGNPCIKFRHHDKDDSLEQRMLKVFIDSVRKNGLSLHNLGGFGDTEGNSWGNYEIQIGQKP